MTLPPPEATYDYTWLGAEIGLIYGIATAVATGTVIPFVFFCALGAFLGLLIDHKPT